MGGLLASLTVLIWGPLAGWALAADKPLTAPTIAGSAKQGQTLTATPGTWTSLLAPSRDEWERCSAVPTCTPVQSAATPYLLTLADAGFTIEVLETASDLVSTQTSLATATVKHLPPVNSTPPGISGTAEVGQVLTAVAGTWTNTPTSFSYQWQRCDAAGNSCTAIPGETNQTYAASPKDVGHALRVLESATNAGGTVVPVSSAATAPVAATASFTSLYAVPTTPVTNQAVTLVATVLSTSSATADRPSGTITFENNGHSISGCINQTVAPSDQSVVVSCQTSFAGGTSPEQLTAVFKPSAGANVGGSTGPSGKPYSLTVGRDATTTDLQLLSSTVNPGGSVIFTATVTPGTAGPTVPTGSVVFLDGTSPIGTCTHQPLAKNGGFVTATCKVTYKRTGKHSISARYGGDPSFNGSTSSPQPLNVHPTNPHCCVTAGMQWKFFYHPSYTTVLVLILNNVPRGASVILGCHGRGCPFKTTTMAVKATLCKAKNKRKCPVQRPVTMQLVGRFHGRHLGVGTKITVQIVHQGWVGKYYGFTIRPGRGPSNKKGCLAPGSSRPGVGC